MELRRIIYRSTPRRIARMHLITAIQNRQTRVSGGDSSRRQGGRMVLPFLFLLQHFYERIETNKLHSVSGNLLRATSPTFADVWSQPRLFYNSLTAVEQQFLINAIRFEASHLTSEIVKQNVLIQLNRVSNDIAKRVAEVIGSSSFSLPPRSPLLED